MTARDLERGSGPDHSTRQGHQMRYGRHGGHHWMMLACCVPMIIIVLALVAAGTISIGFVLFAVLCVGMMALMMRAMDHGSPRSDRRGQAGDRRRRHAAVTTKRERT